MEYTEEAISSCSSSPAYSVISSSSSWVEAPEVIEKSESSLEEQLDRVYEDFVREELEGEISDSEIQYLMMDENDEEEDWVLQMDKEMDEFENMPIKDITNLPQQQNAHDGQKTV